MMFDRIEDLREALFSGKTTVERIVEEGLKRIDEGQHLNAFIEVWADEARSKAKEVQQKIENGTAGKLAGVTLALKDNLCYRGHKVSASSAILENFESLFTATAVERLLAEDAILLGRTGCDEFAMGSSNLTSHYGPVKNPLDPTRVPGGSSGASAVAVAAGMVHASLGSDTGGSIRQPAAVTGTVGVKPTYGGVSRYGLVALASSLDQAGPCARTVLDAALLHEAIAGYDPMDSTSLREPVPEVVAAAKRADVAGMRIGLVKELGGEGYQPGVRQRFAEAVALLEKLGAEVVEVSCPSFDYALAAYYLILPSEASSNLAKFDGIRYGQRVGDDGSRSVEEVMSLSREAGFGAEVKRRIMLGTYALSSGYYDAYYGSAQKVRTLIQRDFAAAFDQVDVLISPTAPTTAFKLGEKLDDPLAMYLNDIATIPVNLAGNAAMSLPIGLAPEDGLPVGLQVIAPAMADDRLYRVGGALERELFNRWGGLLIESSPYGAGSASDGPVPGRPGQTGGSSR